MFKIHKRTIHISTSENSQQRLKNQVEKSSHFSISNILAIPAMIVGAIVGTLVFSVFFAVLLIPLEILGFKAWRMMKSAQKQTMHGTEGDSITAEYTVLSDNEKE
ncbi:MAG: hypothetical protein CVV06_05195 [Gammaproteobacteria bacterium HGW-Gammaproteobacteria-10]|nr:MAG: hypothetical protein CVV06_05195 [Gammaproteobacteria bacterium HGW-Gammaproteobacteria-10]